MAKRTVPGWLKAFGKWVRDDIIARVVGAVLVGWILATLTQKPNLEKAGDSSPDTSIRARVTDSVASSPSQISATKSRAAAVRRKPQPLQTSPRAPWQPPPYSRHIIGEPHTHALEFKLYGDSIIVDALFERDTDSDHRWPVDTLSTPVLSVGFHTMRLLWDSRFTDWLELQGQWVTPELDRAIFMLPKRGLLDVNLRFVPSVKIQKGIRNPRVGGKWTVKKAPGVWDFTIRIRKDGSFEKRDWYNTDRHVAF